MLLRGHYSSGRRAAILPLVAVSLIALFAMVALAVDLGLITLARTQCQNAADIAALAAVRQLNGNTADSTNLNNINAASPTAKTAASKNKVLGNDVDQANVTVQVGYYAYDSTQQKFIPNFSGTKPAGENWSAVQVDVTAGDSTYFAKVFGTTAFSAGASATAVHRPRDIAIILDFSGSMRWASEAAYPDNGDYLGSLNPDPNIPRFGHWSAMTSVMQRTTNYVDSDGDVHSPNNLTIDSTKNGPAIVKDFLMRDGSNNLVNAFYRTTSPYDPTTWACPAPSDWDVQSDTTVTYGGATGKGGDWWPRLSVSFTTGNYAKTVQEYLYGTNNNATYSVNNHARQTTNGPGGEAFDPDTSVSLTDNQGYGPNFKGYSIGPGYHGKTFYLWPPDPRFTSNADPSSPGTGSLPKDTSARYLCDWRKRFFVKTGGSTRVDDNSVLWDSSGNWKQAGQSGNYDINYTAVVKWVKSGPQTLPANLRAGRVLYYSAIPDTIPATGGDDDQKFWRAYIDYVIGAASTSTQKRQLYGCETSGWGTVKITAKSSLATTNPPYMHYNDNPIRPRLHFWFGPLSMLAFLAENPNSISGRNWFPGTCHEAQCWQVKAGVQSALKDIEKNHPNDWASLIYFSGISSFGTARVGLGRNYTRMKNALFFPFNTLDSLSDQTYEVRPYNSSFNTTAAGNIPNGDSYTCPEMAFMVAYNQFGRASGFSGRRGAAKLVLFETDGVPNMTANGTFNNNGTYTSYYSSITNGSYLGNGHATVTGDALDVIDKICALETANPPGYSTAKLPVRVHSIGFGDLFQAGNTAETQARTFLLNVQKRGGTSASDATAIESYKIITGDYDVRIGNLRTALERIMQSGIQVSLIK